MIKLKEKKAVLYTLVLLAVLISPAAAAVITGDVNEDGGTNIVDALFIAQYTAGLRTLTPTQLAAGDVSGDGIVSITDALFIAQYTVGLRTITGAVPLISPVSNNPDPVSVGSVTLTPGGTSTVAIRVTSVTTDIAAATVSLTFNPAIVTVQSVSAGNLQDPTWNINNTSGIINISVFSITPATTAPVTIANVVLKASASAAPGTSPLTLTVQALSDSNGTNRVPGAGGITNGVVTITPANGTIVSIASQTVSPGATVTVPIVAINITNLAAFTITLSYNPAVVWVDSVTSGALGGVIASINNATGVTLMSAFSIFGKSGNITLANVVLRAVGTAGQTSPLNISVTEMIDSNSNNIPVTVLNGTFTVQTASFTAAANRTNVSIVYPPIQPTPVMFTVMLGSTPVSGATVTLSGAATGNGSTGANGTVVLLVSPTMNGTITAAATHAGIHTNITTLTAKGDVNGDNRVTITDALYIAQYAANLRPLNPNTLVFADVSGDGQVTITDAMFIAQATSGMPDRPVPKKGN